MHPVDSFANNGEFGSVQEGGNQLVLCGRSPCPCAETAFTQHFGGEAEQPLQNL